jgi:hypothetical protein
VDAIAPASDALARHPDAFAAEIQTEADVHRLLALERGAPTVRLVEADLRTVRLGAREPPEAAPGQ